MNLDKRKLDILRAVIDDYILTAAPVGSRSISKRSEFSLSSATIRNEMSDLEEMGFLEQPHTSAGRIPSHKAYRLYVNNIMHRAALTGEEKETIKKYFSHRMDDVEAVVKQAASALSDITRYTAMVLPPQLQCVRIRHLQLVPVLSDRALMVLVTDTGLVREGMIRIPEGISAADLEQLSRMLTQSLQDAVLDSMGSDEIAKMVSRMSYDRTFFHGIMDAIDQNLERGAKTVELSGATNILYYPEYSDIAKAKNFLSAIEGQDTLYRMLKRATRLELSISIGSENEQEELKDCSVVTATYKIGNEPMGSFGVIGPTRMSYARILSIMEHMSFSLSEAFQGVIDDEHR